MIIPFIFKRKRTVAMVTLLTAFLLISCRLSAQVESMALDREQIDFGKIATITYVPKTVEFVNKASQPLAILLIEKSRDVKTSYERKFFEPGEKGAIAFSYVPRNTGDFDETVYIYTNLDENPYPLHLTGTVVSVIECFPDPRNMLKRSVEVVDKYTKAPVPEAELVLVHNNRYNNPVKVKTDREGKAIEEMPIGLYHITGEADNYLSLQTEIYVPKSQPLVVLEMIPEKTAPGRATPPRVLTPPPDVLPEEPVARKNNRPVITSSELPEDKYAANNLIFLLDVSTSMKSGKKFVLLQQSVNNLAMILRPIDNVSIISYSNEAHVVLTGAKGNDREEILDAVQELQPYGITRGVKGLNTAYELALNNYIDRGNNQIILMTDGEFSEKGLSDSYYQDLLSGYAARGISLSILGFGVNKEAIDRMKLMCKAGNGSFILVKSDEFVKEVLIEEVKSKSLIGE